MIGRRGQGSSDTLSERLMALERAADLADMVQHEVAQASPELQLAIAHARTVAERAAQRVELSGEHTVVALAGATGSGKSSLLNALAGTEVATVAARRPTTAHAQAVLVRSPQDTSPDPGPLLDWLGIGRRTEVIGDALASTVLIDLPDVDSVRRDHHLRAEHLTQRADVLIWVLDPQKYADAVVHQQYLMPMARHADVMLVVLNQVDTLAPADLQVVLADLRERLTADGLAGVHVQPASALTGAGVADLTTAVQRVVRDRRSMRARLVADIAQAADQLSQVCPPTETAAIGGPAAERLVEDLCAGVGVNAVADAVAASYRMRARARTGWPPTRWLGRLRADPLRRLHLGAALAGRPKREEPAEEPADAVAVPSMPTPDPAALARVRRALSAATDAVVAESVPPWRHYLRAGMIDEATVTESSHEAIAGELARTPNRRGGKDPTWFAWCGALQWLLLAALILGLLWLGAILGMRYLGVGPLWSPQIGPVPAQPPWPALPAIPWPVALPAGAALLGILLTVPAALAAGVGAARRRRRTRLRLRTAIAQVARVQVLDPLSERAEQAREYAGSLHRAG